MKLCRHPHVVRLLEVIDDKLYQKVYMGQFVSVLFNTHPLFVLILILCHSLLGCTMRLLPVDSFVRLLTLPQ